MTIVEGRYPLRLAHGNGLFLVGDAQYEGWFGGWCSTNLVNWQAMDFADVTNVTNLSGGIFYGAGAFVWGGENVILQSGYADTTPPVVGVPPKSTAVYEGERAVFTVTAFGTPPLSYQWRHEGIPIPGATNANIAIDGTQPADAGTYDVVVTNPAGTATSPPAKLEVSWLSIARFAGLRLSGQVGSTLRIEYLESLSSTNWLFLTNVIIPVSPYVWIDYDSPSHPMRFYRAARP
jgi:hypothetical protein